MLKIRELNGVIIITARPDTKSIPCIQALATNWTTTLAITTPETLKRPIGFVRTLHDELTRVDLEVTFAVAQESPVVHTPTESISAASRDEWHIPRV
jgi:hypothetical protein